MTTSGSENKPRQSSSPLVFISHDSRDADLAEALSKLLRSVSAGLLKSFRSSDKSGVEGIEFGDEWYKRLMSSLENASDVVALFTERSINRPWILYEAGVAKGKLNTSVYGIALGVPLSRVGTGPFYQFQNSDDSEDSLMNLVMQLTRRIPSLEPDADVVKSQVSIFKQQSEEILKALDDTPEEGAEQEPNESSVARLLEELKVMYRDLPLRVEERLSPLSIPDGQPRPRPRDASLLRYAMESLRLDSGDPINLLILSSFVKDEAPWIYELASNAYDAFSSDGELGWDEATTTLLDVANVTLRHNPFQEILGRFGDYEDRMFYDELLYLMEMHIQAVGLNRRR